MSKSTGKTIKRFNTSELTAKANFQREVDMKRVAEIARKWDWALMKLPRVADINGTYYIWDGQHTVLALKTVMGGDTDVDCLVDKMTYEEAARRVKEQDKNSSRISTIDSYNIGLEANDPDDVNIQRILSSYDISVNRKLGLNTINCVTVLRKINKAGCALLDETLGLIKNTWPESEDRFKADIVNAVYRIMSTYGTKIIKKHFIEKVSKHTVNYYIVAGRDSKTKPVDRAIAKEMFYVYNYNLKTNKNKLIDIL